MPNWAEGTIKIRGTKDNIRKFLTEGLNPIPRVEKAMAKVMGLEYSDPTVTIEEDEWEFIMSSPNGFHVKGTARAFIEGSIEWYFSDDETMTLSISSFKQAWGVTPEPFINLSKQFEVDIRIYVFEQGMEFNQEIEIHNGQLIKNNEITFDDYQWECIMPELGG